MYYKKAIGKCCTFVFFIMVGILVLETITSGAANASEETQIIVSIVGKDIIDLDMQNRLIRAEVEVINFNPSDGYYFMQVIQPNSGKIVTENEIFIQDRGNQVWGNDIAYLIKDDIISNNGKIVQGEYKINIITEFGSSTGSATFRIIKSSEPDSNVPIFQDIVKQKINLLTSHAQLIW